MEHIEFDYNSISDEHLDVVLENTTPDKVAYYLAYSNMEFGTELLEEGFNYGKVNLLFI